jgi:secreted trypsin-like serine protease
MVIRMFSYGVGCVEAAYSTVYTRVAAYESWINSNTNGSLSTVNLFAYNTTSTSTTRSKFYDYRATYLT